MYSMSEQLSAYLDALARDDCYRVDAVLKDGPFETTQRVFFVGSNGAEQGPFVRKYLDVEAGLGSTYGRIWEAQRAGQRFLHLPRIVDCYEAGGRRAVIMEHVDGETLADAVYRCDPSLALACDVFPRLCDAVRELHEAFDPPIIHRDLKPSNVMLTRDSLTIIDFGIARTYDEQAEEDTRRFGTRAYAPPEQFGFGQTDVRSDVYALGMLLYFCLAEKTPDAKARKEGFRDAGAPEPVRSVIVHATAFDPDDRYGSVLELERAFSEAAGESGAAATASRRDAAAAAAVPACALAPAAPAPSAAPTPSAAPARSVAPTSAGVPAYATAGSRAGAPSYSVRAPKRSYPPPVSATGGAPHSAKGPLARIPLWAGIVWDVLLAALLVAFVAVSVSSAIDPEAGSSMAAESFAFRAASYTAVVAFVFAPVLFVVRDRRPLRLLFPRIPRLRPVVEALIVTGGFAACLLVFMILDFAGV